MCKKIRVTKMHFGEFENHNHPASHHSVPLTVKADSNGYFCHGPPNFEETGTVSDDWKVLLDMDGYSLVYYIVYT